MADIEDEKKLKLESVIAFEIEAFRVESELAAQLFRAESNLRAIESSRVWRYTLPIRVLIDVIIIPFRKSRRGLKFLIFLSKIIR